MLPDKTQFRLGQPQLIRALGPTFHALAEIQFGAWTKYVATTGSTWFDAGVTARERMAAAGFDVAAGDSWAVNELSSAVRRGTASARVNVREFLRGLFTGPEDDGVRGTAFVIGVGQPAPDVSLYQQNLQNWLPDTPFWTDMTAYVSDWSQEVYPDFRLYAVPGAPPQQRRDYLNDYLQHELIAASVSPPTAQAAKTYIQGTYSPLANAAWQWATAYGWTMVTPEQMEDFVSAQVYALRYFSVATGQQQDHWGFAWAPRNESGLTPAQFAAATGLILDRLGAAIQDSADTTDPNDPGSAACGPLGAPTQCIAALDGAHFTETWKSFRAWSQPVLALATPPQQTTAGEPSTALSLSLLTPAGAPQPAAADVGVALTTTSGQGSFSTSPTGPWSPTLAVTIPAGATASSAFYYLDTKAGAPELTATAAGVTTAYQSETVVPGPPATVALTPTSAKLRPRDSLKLGAAAVDRFGNPTPVEPSWTVTPSFLGTFTPPAGSTTTFRAGYRGGEGKIVASVPGAAGTVSASATVTVSSGRLRIGSIRYGVGANKTLLVSARAVNVGGGPIGGALVSIVVRRTNAKAFIGHKRTGADGRAIFRLKKERGRCYRATIAKVTATGYVWDRKTPQNRFCD